MGNFTLNAKDDKKIKKKTSKNKDNNKNDNKNKDKQGLEPYSSFFPAVFGQTVSRCST